MADPKPATQRPTAHPWCEVRGPEDNGRGKLTGFDEVLATGVDVHIERMHDGHYWMCLERDGMRQRIELWAKGGRLYSGTEAE